VAQSHQFGCESAARPAIALTVQLVARFNAAGFDGARMYTIVAGTVLLLSIGILIAHAMDGFRSGS
jgi:hypothetical protein